MEASIIIGWPHVILFNVSVLIMAYIAETRKSKVFLFMSILEMIVVSGIRRGYVDTVAYRHSFIKLQVKEIFSINYILHIEDKDKGFKFFSAIIKSIVNNDRVYLFVLALITISFFTYGLISKSENWLLPIFLFLNTGCYLSTMNGARQALVSAILFVFVPYLIINKRIKCYIIVVILLSTLHGTALLFLPLYFIVNKEPWSSSTFYILFSTMIVFLFFNYGIGNAIVSFLDGTHYAEDYGEMLSSGDTSVNIIRPFVALAPLLLSYYNYKNAGKKVILHESEIYKISFNMSLLNFIAWLFATKVKYFYRLAIYFEPYMILLLCMELAIIRNEKEKKMITLITIVLYTIWHWYSVNSMSYYLFIGYWKNYDMYLY